MSGAGAGEASVLALLHPALPSSCLSSRASSVFCLDRERRIWHEPRQIAAVSHRMAPTLNITVRDAETIPKLKFSMSDMNSARQIA